MASGRLFAALNAAAFMQQVLAMRTDFTFNDTEDGQVSGRLSDYHKFEFVPPTMDDFRKLDGWTDDWWGPDMVNAVLAPLCDMDKHYQVAGMQQMQRYSNKMVPQMEATPYKVLEPFETDLNPDNEEDDEILKRDMCEEREYDEDEDEILDGQETPGLECGYIFPKQNFKESTVKADTVMACKVLKANDGATPEDLLKAAEVGNSAAFPAGWWQDKVISEDMKVNENSDGQAWGSQGLHWKRWFIAGYAPMAGLEGMLWDASEGSVALNAALFMLPLPNVNYNNGVSGGRGSGPKAKMRYNKAEIEKTNLHVSGALHIDLMDDAVPSQPATFLNFNEYLKKGHKETEFEDIYLPRKGSLTHAAQLNKKEDIVLILTMPLALREIQGNPFCGAQGGGGFRALQEKRDAVESLNLLENLFRPLFPTNCQYYQLMKEKKYKDWFNDFSEPRRHAHREAFGVDLEKTPSAELALAWDEKTCPCELKSCKFENYFWDQCASPAAEAPKPVVQVGEEVKEKKSWAAEWKGVWLDLRPALKGCKHTIKRVHGQWTINFQIGVNIGKNKQRDWGTKSCTGARSIEIHPVHLDPAKEINVGIMKIDREDESEWVYLRIVKVVSGPNRGEFFLKATITGDQEETRVWQRIHKLGK